MLIMNNAVKLNGVIKSKSADAQLVFVNLPPPPRSQDADENCNFYLSNYMVISCFQVGIVGFAEKFNWKVNIYTADIWVPQSVKPTTPA